MYPDIGYVGKDFTTLNILIQADKDGITSYEAALNTAKETIRRKKQSHDY